MSWSKSNTFHYGYSSYQHRGESRLSWSPPSSKNNIGSASPSHNSCVRQAALWNTCCSTITEHFTLHKISGWTQLESLTWDERAEQSISTYCISLQDCDCGSSSERESWFSYQNFFSLANVNDHKKRGITITSLRHFTSLRWRRIVVNSKT